MSSTAKGLSWWMIVVGATLQESGPDALLGRRKRDPYENKLAPLYPCYYGIDMATKRNGKSQDTGRHKEIPECRQPQVYFN